MTTAVTRDEPAHQDRTPAGIPADDSQGWGLRGRWRTVAVAVVALVVIAGLVLRFWTRSALWLDEALTVDIARLPLHRIPAALKQDGAPPLYYVLLHFWIDVFGQSDLAVRSLSGVISVVTLPVAWLAARRWAGRAVAWTVLLLLASAPFAVYYGTEARMYSLVMLLTACGLLALDRALERPSVANLLVVAVVTAALLYTQYWAVYLAATVGIWLIWQAWRGTPARRSRALWVLGAVAVGCLAFVPWLPTFIFQARHTGTPWAKPPNFAAVINAITGFTDNQATLATTGTDQGRLLALCYFLLAFLGLFGLARDRWHVDLDIRTRPKGRGVAFVVAATLALAIGGGLISGSAFSPRYAAVVFVPLLLLVALGTLTLADRRIRAGLLAVAVGAGLAGAAQNVTTQRTQAPQVAAVLSAHAQPGDIVAYCPDQIGPAVYRLTQNDGFRQVAFPRRTSPDLIDWVDYKTTAEAASPTAFVKALQAEAGTNHQIWLVWATGYQGFGNKCGEIAGDLLNTPGYGGHQWVTQNPNVYYEPMTLVEFKPGA